MGWGGYIHAKAERGFHVSQANQTCWASRFWLAPETVFTGIWTFEGLVCFRCKEIIR